MRKAQKLIDRINDIGLMIQPEQLANAITERVSQIDQEIAGMLLVLVEFDEPDQNVHETGRTFEDTLDIYMARRDRLLGYITEARLREGGSSEENNEPE